MSRAEDVLYLSLTDVDRLEQLALIGLPEEAIPTSMMRPVVAWAIEEFHRSGRKTAPSREALIETWGEVIDDARVELLPEDEDADTTGWAIDKLKSQFVFASYERFVRESVTAMSEATELERLPLLGQLVDELHAVHAGIQSRQHHLSIQEGMTEALAKYEQRSQPGQSNRGMLFGVEKVDEHTNGIQPGEVCVLAAGPKTGKAQTVDSLVLTPSGWSRMGDIEEGDWVYGRSGYPIKVVAVHPQGVIPAYRVTLADGDTLEVSGDHLWEVQTKTSRPSKVMTTNQIAEYLELGGDRRIYIPLVEPVQYPDAKLPIDPYSFGLLLGDGCFRGSSYSMNPGCEELMHSLIDAGIGTSIFSDGVTVGVKAYYRDIIEDLGLGMHYSLEKRIPEEYLRASVKQRFALLSGLLDTDGGMNGKSTCFYTSSAQLKDDVKDLVESLGGVASVSAKTKFKNYSYTLYIRLPKSFGCPFRYSRKASEWQRGTEKRNPTRSIKKIEYIGEKECQCITVDAPDSLYVAQSYIVTHNSWFLGWTALNEYKRGRRVVLFTLENSVEMSYDRIACMNSGISYRRWQRGQCLPEEVERVRSFAEEIRSGGGHGSLDIIMPDADDRTMQSMVRKAQTLGCQSLFIDQLTFVTYPDAQRLRLARHQEVGKIMHDLKELVSTGSETMPVMIAHQINREGVKAAKKVGYLSMENLAEGSEVERTADWVFGLFQSSVQREAAEATLQILASRREDSNAWSMNWEPSMGLVDAYAEAVLEL